ncbi:MAG: transporter [Thiobacillus sp. 63-78]|uniref:BON domain-containing protein n=1 Tax=Thiobacillus sp. 63-78 TaxID=1895859 RepID=UPI00095D6BCC|nr:BON domain-containing protein [Thiobacillus sp. 63-78]MBN8762856.1 BON domain-containing protein [Thiobacillus sp.]MBN8773767.1 BON domain-containing protein [Thiobacillus sp.]OJZ04226.1 MAG: transporter [Thiobacillus sp. 63-78]
MSKLTRLVVIGAVLAQLGGCAAAVVGGAAVGTSVAMDRRTAGVYVSDQEIELRALARLREAFPQKTERISATSYNRQVLLTGQVPDEATRSRATDVVKAIPDVRMVFNELTVSGVSSLTSGANDTALTGQVKARMLRDERVPATKVKVVTESGVVYLMGLVTKTEAEAATNIARTTSGVAKVVTLFEYLN